MSKFYSILVIMFVIIMSTITVNEAKANRLWTQQYGSWEMFAWNGYWKYCAIKTYVRSDENYEISIRQDYQGYYIAVLVKNTKIAFDPNYTVEIGFNDWSYGVYKTFSDLRTPGMVYVRLGHDRDFLESFMSSNFMSIRGDNVNGNWFDINLNLIGTRYLGEQLNWCTRTYGF